MLNALPWLPLVGFGAPLAVIDWREHRLPNRLVGLLTACALLSLGIVAVVNDAPADFARAFAGGLLLGVAFFVLATIKPAAMGMGDVKLSVVIGAYLAWLGWGWLWWGTIAAFATAALVGLVRRLGPHQHIALGPFLLGAVPICAVASMHVAI